LFPALTFTIAYHIMAKVRDGVTVVLLFTTHDIYVDGTVFHVSLEVFYYTLFLNELINLIKPAVSYPNYKRAHFRLYVLETE
jgi:hypothetical protein